MSTRTLHPWLGDTAGRVLDFIIGYKAAHDGNSPSVREIGEGCGISSTSVVRYHLNTLVLEQLIHIPTSDSGVRLAARIEIPGGKWTHKEER